MSRVTIDKVDVAGHRVLMRVDVNIPIDEDCRITDDRRIVQALGSIQSIRERGGGVILMSHLGRPSGRGYEPTLGLQPVADRLSELLPDCTVRIPGQDCAGDTAARAARETGPGEVILLENLRFHAGEKKGDPVFAARLASFGTLYCNEAFGSAHRNHASMLAVPQAMEGTPRVAGLLLERELHFLGSVLESAGRSGGAFVAVLGGAKVSDKIGAIRHLIGRADHILVGGAMAYTLLAAQGVVVGASLCEEDMRTEAEGLLAAAAAGGTELLLPSDHVCGRSLAPGTDIRTVEGEIPGDWMGLDIGPATVSRYVDAMADAETILWNGPMGVFEQPACANGTRQIAEAIASRTRAGCTSIVGGGDSAAAIDEAGLVDQFSHVSTGGGACLRMLEGAVMESVSILDLSLAAGS